MPLSYSELSTYQLLCIRETYDLIDAQCSACVPDWNIVDFEKEVVSNLSGNTSRIQIVRERIAEGLRELDNQMPLKQYLEQGEHSARELFLQAPEISAKDKRPFLLFWAYVAREYSHMTLPIEKSRCRDNFQSVLKQFKLRLYGNRDYTVERFCSFHNIESMIQLREADLRGAQFTIDGRNQAYARKTVFEDNPIYLDKAKDRFRRFLDNVYPEYEVKEDLTIHELCFAVDSTCTSLQRDYVFLLWGVFTGKPMNLSNCARAFGVTGSRIKACENTVVRNAGHEELAILARPKAAI